MSKIEHKSIKYPLVSKSADRCKDGQRSRVSGVAMRTRQAPGNTIASEAASPGKPVVYSSSESSELKIRER